MTDPVKPKRGIGVGEGIGLAAVLISGLGLWNSWRGDDKPGPTEVVEKKTAVPLVLRGTVEDDGDKLVVAAVEPAHALESLSFAFASGKTVEVGSNATLSAGEVEGALPQNASRTDGQMSALVTARYVEAGTERRAARRYAIRYRFEGGGLFDGKRLRIVDFRRI